MTRRNTAHRAVSILPSVRSVVAGKAAPSVALLMPGSVASISAVAAIASLIPTLSALSVPLLLTLRAKIQPLLSAHSMELVVVYVKIAADIAKKVIYQN